MPYSRRWRTVRAAIARAADCTMPTVLYLGRGLSPGGLSGVLGASELGVSLVRPVLKVKILITNVW